MSEQAIKKRHPRQEAFEFLCGCLGGMSQVIIGQPFDIVKVRIQAQTKENRSSMVDVAKRIWQNEGPLGFYKGTLPPLVGLGACVSIQFGVLESTKRFFRSLQPAYKKELDLKYVFLSGSAAGFANSIISIPAEHLRIRMQIAGSGSAGAIQYNGSLDAAKKIFGSYGIRGIFKGTNITLIREIITYGVYFWMYESLVRKLLKPGQERSELSAGKLMISGAMAGYTYWIFGYPVDLIKTKLQTDSFTNPQYKSAFDCIRQTYKTNGVSGFFRGFLPCMLRAGPVNAGSFLVYETTLKYFVKNF